MSSDGPSTTHQQSAGERTAPLERVVGELVRLSPWKKSAVAGFLVIAAIGLALRATAWFDAGTTRSVQIQTQRDGRAPEDSRSVIDTSRGPQDETAPDQRSADMTADQELPWKARLGGWMAKVGLSFALGVVIGVFFRAFLKTMAMLTALVVAAAAVLGYFGLIDVSSVREGADSLVGWVGERGGAAKDFLVGVLPSAGTGVLGFFIGFLKK